MKKYAITHPLVSRRQAIRLNKVTRSIERVLHNIKMKRLKTVIVNFLLFKPVSDDHDFKATGERRYKHSDGSLWAQIGSVYQITISVNESDIQTLYTLLNDFVTAGTDEFKEGMYYFRRDDTFKDQYDIIEPYTDAFKIIKITPVENSKSKYNPLKAPLRDGNKISINSRYVHTELNLKRKHFIDAMKTGNGRENECWLNALTDYYGDTVLGSNRREVLSREKLLELIGKTEENVKDGCSLPDVMPFFHKSRIPIRIYNEFSKCIFKYDPETPNTHFRVFHGSIKDNHIYTMNYNLKQLEQQGTTKPLELPASSNYITADTKTNDTQATYTMLNNLDDLLTIIKHAIETKDIQIEHYTTMSKKDRTAYEKAKQDAKDKVIFNLIYKTNNLNELTYQIKKAGYDPLIKYVAGSISEIRLRFFGKLIFIIRSHNLLDDAIDGHITVETAQTFNTMDVAFKNLKRAILQGRYKSYYSELDISILDAYRTVVNSGTFEKTSIEEHAEIDICKAFTHALTQITHLPIFNEFDIFKPYHGEEIEPYNVYIVKSNIPNLMLNKEFNLCYGIFLNSMTNIEILYSKKPSMLINVAGQFQAYIDELYNTTISDNPTEDLKIKKLIANVVIGLLDKSYNKTQQAYLYDTLDIAKYHQEHEGGHIGLLQKINAINETVEYVTRLTKELRANITNEIEQT